MYIQTPNLTVTYLEESEQVIISTDYIVKDSITFKQQLLKDLYSSSNSITLTLTSGCAENLKMLKASGDIKAVLKDGATVLFTGYISDNYNWIVNSYGTTDLQITIEDVGTKLLPKSYIKNGTSAVLEDAADTIVRTIATAAGITVDSDFPVISTNVLRVVESGETCQDLIKSLLFEVGYAYYFTNEGKLSAKKIDCESTSGVPVINKDDLYVTGGSAITLQKRTRQYKSSKVSYRSVAKRYETLVYKDISGQDDSHPDCNISLTLGQTYPDPDGGVSYVEAEDLTCGNEIVYIENVVPTVTVSQGTVSSSISQHGARDISVLLTCTSTGGYQNAIVSKLESKADITYIEAENEVIAGVISSSDESDNMYQYESEWIHTKAAADKLANLLTDYYRYCNKQFTFKSKVDIECGAIVKVWDDLFSGLAVNVMVIGRSYSDKHDIYTYSAVSISEFDFDKPTSSTTIHVAPSNVNVPVAPPSAFFDVNLSSGIYKRNSRKTSKQTVSLAVTINGYSESYATVSISEGSFDPSSTVTTTTVYPGTNATIYIPFNNTYDSIIIRAILNATTESRKVISAVNETSTWAYLGALNALPTPSTYGYDSFAVGDHFLAASDFTTQSGDSFMVGNAYFWTGEVWTLVSSGAIDEEGNVLGVDFYATVMSNCLDDGVDVDAPNTSQIGSWVKKLASHEIIADTIMAKELIMTSSGSLRSSQYSEADGYPTSGYKLTSSDGTLRAMNAMLRDVNIKCTDSQNKVLLQTQRYQAGETNINVRNTNLAARWCINDAASQFTNSMTSCTYNSNTRYAYRAENADYTYGYRYLISDMHYSSSSHSGNYGDTVYTVPVTGYYYVRVDGILNTAFPGIVLANGASYGMNNVTPFMMDLGYLEQGEQFLVTGCTDYKVYLYNDSRQFEINTRSSVTVNYSGDWPHWTWTSTFTGYNYIPEVWINPDSCLSVPLTIGTFNSDNNKRYYALSNTLAAWAEGSYNTTNSSVTGGSETLTVTNIGKSSNNISFRDSNYNVITVTLPVSTNTIAETGWYENLSGSISLIAQQSGILTYNVLPSTNQSCSCGTTGQAWAEVVSYGFNSLSARSEKKNIEKYDGNATDLINDTEIVSFNYKNDEKETPKVGFIADDTNSLMATPEHNQFDINNCVGLLLKAVQELSARIEKLEKN